jgi:hypothetical protein
MLVKLGSLGRRGSEMSSIHLINCKLLPAQNDYKQQNFPPTEEGQLQVR